ncbi:hypothetical protein PtB15_2B86 [Puccinia triticina]|nr:hypothetical protein PtB15_2B86 [Puccinia triticina]
MACCGTLKSHTRPIDSLNSYPTVCPTEVETYSSRKSGTLPHLLVSANLMGALKVWLIPSITSAQLWTASANNAVLHSALDFLPSSTQRIVNILRIEQPYFVRCVLNLPLFFAQTVHAETAVPKWLITGSTDKDIRIYDAKAIKHQEQAVSSSRPLHKPEPSATLKTVSNGWFGALKAHWHEVNCLRIWIDSQTHKPWLVSSGLDGTLRKWELTTLQRRFAPHIGTHSIPSHAEPASHTKKEPQFKLTAKEEAELAEIMDEMN